MNLYDCQVNCDKEIMLVFQNGFLSAIPFVLCYILGVGGGQVADWLRYSNILTTTAVRKVFATGGELKVILVQCL